MAKQASKSLRVLLSYGDDYLRSRFNRKNLQSLVKKCESGTEIITLSDPTPEEILRNVIGDSLFGNFHIVTATFSAKLPDLTPMFDVLLQTSAPCFPLLITTPDTRSGKSLATKLEKAHGKGVIHPFGMNRCNDSETARRFIESEFMRHGRGFITPQAVTLLSEICLQDFGMLAGEVETLVLVKGEDTVDEDDVLKYTTPSAPNLNFLNVYMGVLKGDFSLISDSLHDMGPAEFEPLSTVVLKILTAALGGKPPKVDFDIPAFRPQWQGESKPNQKDKALTPFVLKVGAAVSKKLRKQEIMSLFTDMYSAAHDYRRSPNKSRAIMTLRVTLRRLCGHDFRH